MDFRAGDATALEIVEAHGPDSGTQRGLFCAGRCAVGVGPEGGSEAVVFQRRGHLERWCRERSRRQRARCATARRKPSAVRAAPMSASSRPPRRPGACCLVAPIGTDGGERRLTGARVVVDREEEVIMGRTDAPTRTVWCPYAPRAVPLTELGPLLAKSPEPHVTAPWPRSASTASLSRGTPTGRTTTRPPSERTFAESAFEKDEQLHPLVKISGLGDGRDSSLRAVCALWRAGRAIQPPLWSHTGDGVGFGISREGGSSARPHGISSSLRGRPVRRVYLQVPAHEFVVMPRPLVHWRHT